MSEEKKSSLAKLGIFKKLKFSKNISIAIAIILSLVVLLVFCSSLEKDTTSDDVTEEENISMIQYTKNMENKLKSVLSEIDGVENVNVMITFEDSIELIISTSKETKTIQSGNSTTTVVVETPILVTEKGVSKPIVLQEKLPEPKSVFIVAKGANDTKVKLEIIKAVEVLFSLPSSKIEVLAGK